MIEEPDLVLGESDDIPSSRELVEDGLDAGTLFLDDLTSNGNNERERKSRRTWEAGSPSRPSLSVHPSISSLSRSP
jgi:hypothetical protein